MLKTIFSSIVFKLGYQAGKREAQHKASIETKREEAIKTDRESLDEKIKNFLTELGFSPRRVGTTYLKEALMLALGDSEVENERRKVLYWLVAKKLGASEDAVAKGIRCAIEDAWFKGDYDEIDRLYPFEWSDETGRPTNAEFIRNTIKLLREGKGGHLCIH